MVDKQKPEDVLEQGLIAAMQIVGDTFKRLEVYIPEVLMAAKAMKAGVAILRPLLAEGSTAAIELGPYGININGIIPAFIEGTNINPPRRATNPVYLKQCLLTISCKHFGKVKDPLGTAVLLASNESDYIQGESIVIDGGLTIQTEDDLGELSHDTSYGLGVEGVKTSYGQAKTRD